MGVTQVRGARRVLLKTAGLLLLLLLVSSPALVFRSAHRDSIIRAWGSNSSFLGTSTKYSATKQDLFYYLITKEEREMFRTNLATFLKVVPRNVTYFIEGGTLLGAYRHGGMIPWDDDLDLLVKDSDGAALRTSLMSLEPEYQLNTRDKLSWKFSHSSSKLNPEKFKWPFLDIFFYLDNATHLWISQKAFKDTVYEKSLIFPLRNTAFMDLQVPAPNNISAILSKLFDVDECVTNRYNHRREKCRDKKLVVSLPCHALYNKFSFSPSYLNRTSSSQV